MSDRDDSGVRFVTSEQPAVLRLVRQQPGQFGWAIVGPTGAVITVLGSLAMGLTRWEARQTLGLIGLPWKEQA